LLIVDTYRKHGLPFPVIIACFHFKSDETEKRDIDTQPRLKRIYLNYNWLSNTIELKTFFNYHGL